MPLVKSPDLVERSLMPKKARLRMLLPSRTRSFIVHTPYGGINDAVQVR